MTKTNELANTSNNSLQNVALKTIKSTKNQTNTVINCKDNNAAG